MNTKFTIESETKRADQISINCQWLIEQLDSIHDSLCPDHTGTWQDRAIAAVEAAESIKKTATFTIKKGMK